jgi:uncharacterized membrane protein HdeD (DUF308 family)
MNDMQYNNTIGDGPAYRLRSLCPYWTWLLITGILLILLGSIALGSVVFATFTAVLFFGILLIAAGIVQLIQAFGTRSSKEFFLSIIIGLLSTVAGVITLRNPGLSVGSFTLILGFYLLAAGLFKTIAALSMHYRNWGWLLVSGLITTALGLIIVLQWPASSLWVIGTLLAIDFIFSGWSYVALSLTVRDRCRALD